MKQFKSPTHKLITFFEKSRDGWKKRSDRYKARLESIRSKVRSLERSRDNWKEKYQQLVKQLNAENRTVASTANKGESTPPSAQLAMPDTQKSASGKLPVIKKRLILSNNA
jgi:uncharacterized coiled-coil DUF342 family protein